MTNLHEMENVTFEKSFKGYNPDEVDKFIDDTIELVKNLEQKNAELDDKISVLAEKLEEYRDDEDNLRTALLGAQRLGDSVVKEAKQKAETLLKDATIKSEAMMTRTKDKILLEEKELLRVQKEVTDFKNSILSLYKSHLESISQVPALEEKPEEEPETEEIPEATEAEEETVGLPEEKAAEETKEPVKKEGFVVSIPDDEKAAEPERESKFADVKLGAKFNLFEEDGEKEEKE